jgi:hypothetical protein
MDIVLRFAKNEFQSALDQLAECCDPMRLEEAILRFDGASFRIGLAGGCVALTACGHWPGEARVKAKILLNARKVLPADDAISLYFESGYLKLNNLTMTAVWQDSNYESIDLPVNASIFDYLAMPLEYEKDQIMKSGLTGNCSEMKAKAEVIINKAAESLTLLEITTDDLWHILMCKVKKRTRWLKAKSATKLDV